MLDDDDNINDNAGNLKWSKVIKRVKEKTLDHLEWMDNLRDSPVYQGILAEEYRLLGYGYDRVEAEYSAWKNKKLHLKQVLKEALESLEKDKKEESEEEESEEETMEKESEFCENCNKPKDFCPCPK